MTVSEARELIPLHALGALDAATAREVEAYLLGAPLEEQREAAEFREVVALLPFALLSPSVSTELKGQLLHQLKFSLAEDIVAPATVAPVLEFKPRAEKQLISQQRQQWLAIAASALLAATSTFLYWQNRELKAERALLAKQLERTQNEIEQMQAPTTRVFALQGKEAPQASAKVFWDTARQQWVVMIFNLPAPPAGMEYQLWYVTKDAKLSAAVFRPNVAGRQELRLALPQGIPDNLAATAVTLEPQGGSSQPTGKFYLLAQL